jgi:anti-anti-sigma factor
VGIKVRKKKDKTKIEVTSNLKGKIVTELYQELLDLTAHPTWEVCLDLKKVNFADAAGLGLLFSTLNTFPAGSISLKLSASLKRLFSDLGLDGKTSHFLN